MNTDFQKKTLMVNESHSEIQTLIKTLQAYREIGFGKFWAETTKQTDVFGVEPLKLPGVRKLTRKSIHVFISRRILSKKCSRFNTDQVEILGSLEKFIISESKENQNESLLRDTTNLYRSDLNPSRLKLHGDTFLDYFNEQNGRNPASLQEVEFFSKEKVCGLFLWK